MHKQLVAGAARLVMLLDNVVDVGDRAADEEGKHESDDVVAMRPNVDVDRVEDSEEGEAPANTVDNDRLAVGGELIKDGAEEEEVNEGPDAERPRRRGNVGLLARAIGRGRSGNGVNVGPKEDKVRNDVYNLLGG